MTTPEGTRPNKALTQGEIDALLSSLANGQLPTPSGSKPLSNVRPYDFRRPDKFSRENLKSLQTVHEGFIKLASLSLSTYLRTTLHWILISVEQVLQEEYFASITQPTLLFVVEMQPLDGEMIMEMSLPLATAMVDRMLGGEGSPIDKPRDLTEIEIQLLRNIASVMLKCLKEAWSGILEVNPTVTALSTSVTNVLEALYNEPVAVIGFEVRMPKVTGTVSMSLPYTLLEPVLPKLTRQTVFSRYTRSSAEVNGEHGNTAVIAPVNLDLVAILGTAKASLAEILNLREGDVVVLDRYVNQGILVAVDGQPKYTATPARQGNRLVVQITDRIEGGGQLD